MFSSTSGPARASAPGRRSAAHDDARRAVRGGPPFRPPSQTSPESGRNIPLRILMVVDLPAPFSPRSACAAPVSTAKLASTSAFVAPKAFDRFFAFKARPLPGIALLHCCAFPGALHHDCRHNRSGVRMSTASRRLGARVWTLCDFGERNRAPRNSSARWLRRSASDSSRRLRLLQEPVLDVLQRRHMVGSHDRRRKVGVALFIGSHEPSMIIDGIRQAPGLRQAPAPEPDCPKQQRLDDPLRGHISRGVRVQIVELDIRPHVGSYVIGGGVLFQHIHLVPQLRDIRFGGLQGDVRRNELEQRARVR